MPKCSADHGIFLARNCWDGVTNSSATKATGERGILNVCDLGRLSVAKPGYDQRFVIIHYRVK